MDTDLNLIVIGGGPGGSSLATMVAMQGHRVLLLERDTLPRYQIGESLLPSTIHGICRMLGLRDELRNAGFVRKNGGTFRWGQSPEPWTFAFGSALSQEFGHAYQVERARFDKILLDNARRHGVDVRERHCVEELLIESGRAVGVRFTDAEGYQCVARARFVADASGHRSRTEARFGERIYAKFFRNIALFGYFEGGKRLPPPNDGNILCAAFDNGWFWYIPLSPTLTSVGAVIAREHAHKLQQEPERALRAFIDSCPLIQEYLSGATRVTEGMYGEIRTRKDYSYTHSRFWMPGAVLVGDAACFIDPVFSSGVHLATYSALLAARSINTVLAGKIDEASCFEEFERRYRREYGNFYEFLVAFYDMHQQIDSYFWKARKVLNTDERDNDAFIRLVAGMSANAEPAYTSQQYFEDRAGIGEAFQRFADGPLRGHYIQPPSEGFEVGAFLHEVTRESVQLQAQALLGQERPAERQIFTGGLVPSRDGFHWDEVAATNTGPTGG